MTIPINRVSYATRNLQFQPAPKPPVGFLGHRFVKFESRLNSNLRIAIAKYKKDNLDNILNKIDHLKTMIDNKIIQNDTNELGFTEKELESSQNPKVDTFPESLHDITKDESENIHESKFLEKKAVRLFYEKTEAKPSNPSISAEDAQNQLESLKQELEDKSKEIRQKKDGFDLVDIKDLNDFCDEKRASVEEIPAEICKSPINTHVPYVTPLHDRRDVEA